MLGWKNQMLFSPSYHLIVSYVGLVKPDVFEPELSPDRIPVGLIEPDAVD
jgi:hypothetical protein